MSWDDTKTDGVDGLTAAEWNTHVTDQKTRALYSDARFKVINATHDISLSNDQTINGVGFTPKAVICLAVVDDTAGQASWGMCDSGYANGLSIRGESSAGQFAAAFDRLILLSTATTSKRGTVKTWDADGITITWATIAGSPTGTANMMLLFFR